MVESYKKFWNNIFNFSGTSNRPDYWWPVIINAILGVIIGAILQIALGHSIDTISNPADAAANIGYNIMGIIVWIATLALQIRRLHDTDRSGWWVFLPIIPFIGGIWLFILFLLPTKQNRWS